MPPKLKPRADEFVHLSFEIRSELLDKIDEESERMEEEDPYQRRASRSETVRVLILDGLKVRADRRAS